MAYKIVLDAGHGGEDPGAVYKDRKEKDDNLKLTLAVGKILEENGVDVVYTRTTDVYQTPFEKAKAANEAGADFFISFHLLFNFTWPVVHEIREYHPLSLQISQLKLQGSQLSAWLTHAAIYKLPAVFQIQTLPVFPLQINASAF